MKITHKFVKNIPQELEDKIVYISMEYSTAIHKCCCGCGNQVVTPFSPTDWRITFNGESVTFYPSIGNWEFACQSHYWIRNSEIEWAPKWTRKQIEDNNHKDHIAKKNYYEKSSSFFSFLKKKSDK